MIANRLHTAHESWKGRARNRTLQKKKRKIFNALKMRKNASLF
jgi:hypothetical protein